ncbi:hypothetical protein Y032_0330g2704 [Ancylostoma ceylanicum]|uniref:ShKT domain-containing protein n=1 Tax=Ancylostoma ceylanicum TaxID=53326 RepID=A0A016RZP0_9BILA|nr:hypothetical protein Y032_0330g2704 [Ancylostoma ceylanicum]
MLLGVIFLLLIMSLTVDPVFPAVHEPRSVSIVGRPGKVCKDLSMECRLYDRKDICQNEQMKYIKKKCPKTCGLC